MLPHKIINVVLAMAVLSVTASSMAESLPLTPTQIKTLQHVFPAAAVAATHADNSPLIWQGNPLTVELPLNQEKRIIFPTKVSADLKSALTTAQLRILNNDKSLYLTALKPFAKTRLLVTLQDTGEVVLVDLVISPQANNAPTAITIQQNNNARYATAVTTHTVNNAEATTFEPRDNDALAAANDNPIRLLQFAWQQLYAPQRLLSNPLGIGRTPLRSPWLVTTLLYGDKVYAHPIASWIYDGTYITAVELRNKYLHAAVIDLAHDVCGNWQAAALYPRRQLKPAGDSSGDSTVLFLVAKQPFAVSLEACNGRA